MVFNRNDGAYWHILTDGSAAENREVGIKMTHLHKEMNPDGISLKISFNNTDISFENRREVWFFGTGLIQAGRNALFSDPAFDQEIIAFLSKIDADDNEEDNVITLH